ncbi:DNA mismatch repair protein [Mactra antiquata]
MAQIEPLPATLRSYLRTGVSITSLTQCVEELVLNSVDAGASCIAVRVNLSCFKVQVVDNGDGIPNDQLEKLGNRYCTSKCHSITDIDNLSHYGYRGEALASIVECCGMLEVVTRSKVDGKTFLKSFKNGKILKISLACNIRPSVGTTVTVQQLFQNFPVRQKSMNQNHEIGRLRETLEGIALVKPGISFSLRNDQTGQVILASKKCLSISRTFSQLFGATKGDSLVEVNGSNSTFQVHGYISREGHQRKNLQFVYVNGRLVKKSKIHKLLKKLLLNLPALKPKLRPLATSPRLSPSTKSFFSPPPKFSEAFPVYVIEIKCPIHEYDITFDPAKTMVEFKDWDSLLSCVSEIVETFLKNENVSIQFCLNSATTRTTLLSEGQESKDAPVIAADNLKDVLVSKMAKRVSTNTEVKTSETTENTESLMAAATPDMKTPENSQTVYCRAAVGLGKRGLMEDGSKSDLDNTDTSPESQDGSNIDVNKDKCKDDIMSMNAPANVSSTQYVSSLSYYKQSIGKSAPTSKLVSVDESLQKLNKLFPTAKNKCLKNNFSSLEKFRSKFSGNSLLNNNVSKTVQNEYLREERSVSHKVSCVADMIEENDSRMNVQKTTKHVSFDVHTDMTPDTYDNIDNAQHNDEEHSLNKHHDHETNKIFSSGYKNLSPEKPIAHASSDSYSTFTGTTDPCVACETTEKIGNQIEEHYTYNIENNSKSMLSLSNFDKSSDKCMINENDELFKTSEEKKVNELNSVLGKRSLSLSDSSDVVNKKQCLYFARPYYSGMDDITKTVSNVSNEVCSQLNDCNMSNCDKQLDIMPVQYRNHCDNSNCDKYNLETALNSNDVVVEYNSIETNEYVNCVDKSGSSGINDDAMKDNELDSDKTNGNSNIETVNESQTLTLSIEQNARVMIDIDDDFDRSNGDLEVESVQETQAFTPQIDEKMHNVETNSDVSIPESLGFSPVVQNTEKFDSPCSAGFEYVDITDNVENKSQLESSSVVRSGFSIVNGKERSDPFVENQPTADIVLSDNKLLTNIDYSDNNDSYNMVNSVNSVGHSTCSANTVLDLKCDSVTITQLLKSPTQERTNHEVSQMESENCKGSLTDLNDDVYSRDLFSETDNHFTNQATDDTMMEKSVTNDVNESAITDTYDNDGVIDNNQTEDFDNAKTCNECSMINEQSDCSWDLSLVPAGQVTKKEENANTLTENKEKDLGHEQQTVNDLLGSASITDDGGETFNATDTEETCQTVDKNLVCGNTNTGSNSDNPCTISSDLESWFKNLDVITDKMCTSNVLHTDQPSNLVKKLHACRFSKQALKSVKVLGQVDKKFIACLIDTESSLYTDTENKTMFILIDQHAAHERIRLEILTEEAFEDGSRGGKLTSYIVDQPQCLSFTSDEVRLILEFKHNYLKLGIDFDRKSSTSLLIKTIPECLVYKEKNRIYWSTIQVLMREYLSVFMSTTAVHGVLPQTIHKVLCSLACHGAIKFGDKLNTEECTKLINDLSLCDLPFQCAHGRPSVMPLFDTKRLEHLSSTKVKQKPNLQKLKRNMKS